jgi:hypothetical protein
MLNSNNILSENIEKYLSKERAVIITITARKIHDLTQIIHDENQNISDKSEKILEARKITIDIMDSILDRKPDVLEKIIQEKHLSKHVMIKIKELHSLLVEGRETFIEEDLQKIGFDQTNPQQNLCLFNIIKEQSFCGARIFLHTCYDTLYPEKEYLERQKNGYLKQDLNFTFEL